jgi:lipid-binding SYLF domain-containing protein
MMRPWTLLGIGLLLAAAAPLRAGPRETRTVEAAAETVHAFADLPLRHIPHELMRQAQGVAVIPGVVKAGLLVDGRFGRGVVLARQPDGTWSNPVFLTLAGGGVGWQVGVQSTDLILIFKTRTSLDRFFRGKGKLTLGGDVSVAAGLLGREAEAATDARLKAEILSYSRSRGLFAGVSLEGAALLVDHRANEAFYGVRGGGPADVLAVRHELAAVQGLKAQLARLGPPPAAPVLIVPAPAPPPPPVIVVPAPVPTPPPPPAGPPAPPPGR